MHHTRGQLHRKRRGGYQREISWAGYLLTRPRIKDKNAVLFSRFASLCTFTPFFALNCIKFSQQIDHSPWKTIAHLRGASFGSTDGLVFLCFYSIIYLLIFLRFYTLNIFSLYFSVISLMIAEIFKESFFRSSFFLTIIGTWREYCNLQDHQFSSLAVTFASTRHRTSCWSI